MQYIDLQPFEDYIRKRNLVDERYLSFYLNWVMRFLRSDFDREHLVESDLLQCFSETTMIYTHVVRTMSNRPKSPLDTL